MSSDVSPEELVNELLAAEIAQLVLRCAKLQAALHLKEKASE